MKTYLEYWNIGTFGGTGRTIDSINKFADHKNAEIVGITYTSGDLIVIFKEKDNEQRAD